MEIHFRLRDFREANGILQSEISEVLGINQSNISRLEAKDRSLTSLQYKKLAEKYGETIVSAYVGEETLKNVLGNPRTNRTRKRAPSAKDDALAIIKAQQDEIARLNRRIEELTELLLKRQ